MSTKTKTRWENLRTTESRRVESALRKVFPHSDAYRYNSASIRVRVVDPRFKGKSTAQRATMVERAFESLDADTKADIINLLALYPDETEESSTAAIRNIEFEDPTPSIL